MMVKMALLAPIPRARPTTATKVKLGLLASRNACPHVLFEKARFWAPSGHPDIGLVCISLILLRRVWSKLDVQVFESR